MRRGSIVQWCQAWRAFSARRASGHIAVYMAVLLTSLMGLAGAGVDYGLIVIESARLQNALDAASLAGARALVLSNATTQGAATNPAAGTRNYDGQQAAIAFLSSNGYTNGANGATFTFTPSASVTGASNDTMQVQGTVVKPTSFWKAIGINSTTITQSATAVSSGGMVDVMLSLDLTGSMELSGTNDLENLRDAVDAFIDQMQISSTVTRGTRMGIARWAGLKCSWYRGTSAFPASGVADNDQYIDWDRGPSSNTGEYTTPCHDDATVLSYLSTDKDKLKKIASNSGTATCPSAPAAPATPTPYSPAPMSEYACPLQSWRVTTSDIPQSHGTPTTIQGTQGGPGNPTNWSQFDGTKLSNAIKIVNGDVTGCYAWGTSTTACPTNGRNNAASADGLARKVLVIMTDGFSQGPNSGLSNEGVPSTYPTYTTIRTPVQSLSAPDSWDNELIDLADRLKKGPDNNLATTDDNVEIFVVGFFPVPYNSTPGTTNWARSRAAATGSVSAGTHPCPASTLPSPSSSPKKFSYVADSIAPGVDEILNTVASSTAGSCDHYFPIAKSEGASLPQLFRVMAGSIARGRLQ